MSQITEAYDDYEANKGFYASESPTYSKGISKPGNFRERNNKRIGLGVSKKKFDPARWSEGKSCAESKDKKGIKHGQGNFD